MVNVCRPAMQASLLIQRRITIGQYFVEKCLQPEVERQRAAAWGNLTPLSPTRRRATFSRLRPATLPNSISTLYASIDHQPVTPSTKKQKIPTGSLLPFFKLPSFLQPPSLDTSSQPRTTITKLKPHNYIYQHRTPPSRTNVNNLQHVCYSANPYT